MVNIKGVFYFLSSLEKLKPRKQSVKDSNG
jgi:hypothetical protein